MRFPEWPLRVTVALVGVESTMLAILLWQLRGEETFVPLLWPVLFGLAAVGTWVLVFSPRHRWALYLSIVGLVCGHLGRSLAVVLNMLEGTVAVTEQRAWVMATELGLVAFLIAYVWLVVLAPQVEANRLLHRSRRASRL